MKTRMRLTVLWALVLAFVTSISFSMALGGEVARSSGAVNNPGSRVIDEAGVLDKGKVAAWEGKIRQLTGKYDLDVMVLFTTGTQGKEPRVFLADQWEARKMGVGADSAGVMMLVATETRDVSVVSAGKGRQTFNDYGIDLIIQDLKGVLKDNQWDESVNVFLKDAEEYMEQDAKGQPYSSSNPRTIPWWLYASSLGGGLLIGIPTSLAIVGGLKRKHNTLRQQVGVRTYMVDQSFVLHNSSEELISSYTTQSSRSSSSSSGGSSDFSSSSGGSYSGGSSNF